MTKVQFNPSTLKVSYTAATSKVQVMSLVLCNVNSGIMTVTFSGISQCPGESWPSDPNTSFELTFRGQEFCHFSYDGGDEGWFVGMDCYAEGWHIWLGVCSLCNIFFFATSVDVPGSKENSFDVDDCYDGLNLRRIRSINLCQCDNEDGCLQWFVVAGYDGSVSIIWSP